MPDPAAQPALHAYGLTVGQWADVLKGWGEPAFRAGQVAGWVWEKGATSADQMTNLPKRLRARIAESVAFDTAAEVARQDSADGTIKLLLTWPDGQSAETVMIPDGPRRTACVSSQVGCPVGCRFCASGMKGKQGDLTAGRIVEQAVRLNRLLAEEQGARLTNLVFMGMGEPLANYGPVLGALRVLTGPGTMRMSPRRITLSTVGVPARIRQLAAEELPLNLALSLHAPNEPLRRELIPWADHFALGDILDACGDYFRATGREVTFEYILLRGVNDRPHHADELAGVCRAARANVNLLRYNEVDGLPFDRPASADVAAFQERLRRAGVNAHVRRSRGRDIDAACGQLRRKRERERELVQLGGAA